jgi:phosphatidylethanolamine/phosphatidyl-N-methylethanolamine N-methyltransferase
MESNVENKQGPVPHASPLYKSLVPAYKAIWPALASKRIHDAVRSLDIPTGASVLEVGVGTGMSLESYRADIEVTGVDLSESMLAAAVRLIEDRQWSHIHVRPMNAEDLDFDDASFDFVTSFHTISVVSDPHQMMSELVRVCKPGGRILMVNHFRSENPVVAGVVDSAGVITKRMGWRTDLGLQEIIRELPVQLDDRYKPNPMSLFTVLKATRKPK